MLLLQLLKPREQFSLSTGELLFIPKLVDFSPALSGFFCFAEHFVLFIYFL